MATEDQKFKAGKAKDKASQTAQAAKDRTTESKDQTGSYISNTAGATRDKAGEVVQTTKDWAIAGKDKTTSALGNAADQVKCAAIGATDQVKSAAVGATEAVKNTFGMGAKDTTAGKDNN